MLVFDRPLLNAFKMAEVRTEDLDRAAGTRGRSAPRTAPTLIGSEAA